MATKSSDPLSSAEVEAWEGLLYISTAVIRELERRFPREAGLSGRDYDVLATLEETSAHALRMSELAANVILSLSRLTRLVQGLERRGLVEREPDPDDRRAVFVRLSTEGLRRFQDAQLIHHEVVRSRFLARLSRRDLRSLGPLWRRVLQGSHYEGLLEEHVQTARHREHEQ